MSDTELLHFDSMFLNSSEPDKPGGLHLATEADVAKARNEEEDHALILSDEAEKFCRLITLHGKLPSEAYELAFSREVTEYDDQNQPRLTYIKPDLPAYQSRVLLRQPEVKERIEQVRAEIREWSKTEISEVEHNLRSIAFSPSVKDSDRIAATKQLSALRGFDVQPELLPGAQIILNLPFTPQTLGRVIEGEAVNVSAA